MRPTIASFLIALLCLTACKTTNPDGTANFDNMEWSCKFITYNASGFYLLQHPDQRFKFEVAKGGLDALIADGSLDPAALANFLATTLPISELRDGPTAILFGSAALILEKATSQLEPVNALPAVTAVATGIRDGLALALQQTANP